MSKKRPQRRNPRTQRKTAFYLERRRPSTENPKGKLRQVTDARTVGGLTNSTEHCRLPPTVDIASTKVIPVEIVVGDQRTPIKQKSNQEI